MHTVTSTTPLPTYPTPRIRLRALLLAMALTVHVAQAAAASTAFTWQGLLQDSGTPATHYDFEVQVFDADAAGNPLGTAMVFDDVLIEDGRFLLTLDPGNGVFTGDPRWLELRVRRGGDSGGYTQLLPRHAVHALPYAQHAQDADFAASVAIASVGAAQLASASVGTAKLADAAVTAAKIDTTQVQRRITGSCPTGQYFTGVGADGTASCAVVDGSAGVWSQSGNAGTDPAIDYLGTSDAQPLQLRTNGVDTLRLQAGQAAWESSSGTDYVFEGANLVTGQGVLAPDLVGSVLLGGDGYVSTNSSGFIYEVPANRIDPPAVSTNLPSHFVSIGGGLGNVAAGFAAVIGGGLENQAGSTASVGGGFRNSAGGNNSVVAGGETNSAAGAASAVGGGDANQAAGNYAVVAGGHVNSASGSGSAVVGGSVNAATGHYSAIAGGMSNSTPADGSAVLGGEVNRASGNFSSVAGGSNNTSSGHFASVAGGSGNCAGGNYSWAGGRRAKVRVGTASGAAGAGCVGVSSNGTNGDQGSFVWADSRAFNFTSTGVDRFEVRATGGVRLVSGINASTGAVIAGVNLAAGSGSWASLSDRHAKADIAAVDPTEVLARVLALPIYTWRYRAQGPDVRHMGPMAQDFHAAFGLNGDDDTRIAGVDPDGAALAAIQGLHAELEAAREQLAAMRAENDVLRVAQARQQRALDALLRRVDALESATVALP